MPNRNPFRRPPPPPPAESAPRPSLVGTAAMLAGLAIVWVLVSSGIPRPERFAAFSAGGCLMISSAFDWKMGGARNLIRADYFSLLALYFLVFFEFFFPQPEFKLLAEPEAVAEAVLLVLYGLAGLALGRHVFNLRRPPFADLFVRPTGKWLLPGLFWFAFLLGHLHMLVAVRFDPAELVHYMMEPRFSQPWSRGRLGDWKALLSELTLMLYLIPPLAGVVFAHRKGYGKATMIAMALGLVFVFFGGFTSGTRNVVASYLLTFLIGYAFALPAVRRGELYILSAACAAMLLLSTVLMLEFRGMGLNNYLAGERSEIETTERRLSIDNNLYSISRLTEVFPDIFPFLGWEVPYLALVRPIPRALWKGKPEGLSRSIEDVMGADGWTVSATFVGEAYMAGGPLAVFFTGLFFGALAGWWGHLASPRNSEFGILVYASGFFAAAISMRSVFTFTTAILPTLGVIILGALVIRKTRVRRGAPAT